MSKTTLDEILAKHNGELGVTWEDPDVVTPDTKQAILRWHNKQIEEALDRLLDGTTTIHFYTQPNNPVESKIEPMFFKAEIKAAIEAERKKLKGRDYGAD